MNREVKRYDPISSDGTCGMCIEDADFGAYVEYEDYVALETECDSLWSTYVALVDKLGIDTEKAKTSDGKPSDVIVSYVDKLRAENDRLRAERDAFRDSRNYLIEEISDHLSEVQRLREALPYLRNAVAEASASGVAQLAVVSTKPDGSGELVCKFECVEFMADLAAVVGAGPQTEDDDASAEALKFLQRNGIASTGREV